MQQTDPAVKPEESHIGLPQARLTCRAMKQAARKTVKKHYLFLILMCLTAAVLGTEFSESLSPISQAMVSEDGEEQIEEGSGITLDITASSVLISCIEDGVEAGSELSGKLREQMMQSKTNPALGRQRGVLSAMINYFSSGAIWVSMLSILRQLVHSSTAASALLIIAVIIGYCLFLIMIRGFFSALLRRIALECRLYKHEPFTRLLHFIHIKRWTRASLTILVSDFLQVLWSLTIVGGIIKRYSYYLVPYITAENADIKPLQAITLSRKMMDGHKWDCFVKELSFIGWAVLSLFTFGLSDLLFANAYQCASFCEYYAWIRAQSIAKGIEGTQMLNDKWLFETAPSQMLDEAYREEKAQLASNVVITPKRNAFTRILADWFGVVLYRTPEEVAYEKSRKKQMVLQESQWILEKEAYPVRLSPYPDHRKDHRIEGIYYDRNYTLTSICLLFLGFSFMGWLWEGMLATIETGSFVNRGALLGPWLPIYGRGCVLVLLLLKKLRKKPMVHFFATIALCGIVEYATGVMLETMHGGQKWWDYSGYFLNLNGRVCAEGLLVFGVLGSFIVYMLAPLVDSMVRQIPMKIAVPITVILMTCFTVDDIHSMSHPNSGAGITDIQSP